MSEPQARAIYQVDDGETHIYVALDEVDAARLHEEIYGSGEVEADEIAITRVGDMEPVSVGYMDDLPESLPTGARISWGNPLPMTVTATARAWVEFTLAESGPESVALCSSVY